VPDKIRSLPVFIIGIRGLMASSLAGRAASTLYFIFGGVLSSESALHQPPG
jgi:hypothetical protein